MCRSGAASAAPRRAVSPCLDRQWPTRGRGVLLRYADDLLAICQTRRDAENALEVLTAILAEMGLELKQAKTRIGQPREGGEGVDSSGSSSLRARPHPTVTVSHLPRPLALTPGRGTRSPAHPGDHGALAAQSPSRDHRARPQPVLCAAGRATSATELRPVFRQDHAPRAPAPRRVHRPATQTPETVRLVGRRSPDARTGLIDLNGIIIAPRPTRSRRQGS